MTNSKNVTSKIRPVGNIPEEAINETTKFLNGLLADEYALFTKTLNYHWNVTGPRFHSMHNFLEEQYKTLLPTMDAIAERVRVMGETPLSTVKEMSKTMSLSEKVGKDMSTSEMIEDLYVANMTVHEDIKNFMKDMAAEHDPVTEDFLTGLLENHEMRGWMLKSHLS